MFTPSQKAFISNVEKMFGQDHTISRTEIDSVLINSDEKIPYPHWLTSDEYRVSRGYYKVPTIATPVMENVIPMKKQTTPHNTSSEFLIPERDKNFEKYGFYNDLKNIIKSKRFYPIFISGTSGIGKTFLVEQVCAELKRECIRVNFSVETDQTDLIGGPTLVDGNITYSEGPVITCLRNGYVLLLDEIDRCNSNNILILNGILEGRGFFNPKTGEYIKAKEGFNIITTANSKGYGDESGKYLSQILDSAFLERFPITLEQEFPSEKVETKILKHHSEDVDFVEKLVKWAKVIRKTYENGGIDEIISTRRLVHICEAYGIFGDKLKAINLCVSRFESHTKDAFVDLYTKIDANVLNLDDDGNVVETSVITPTEDVPEYI